MAADRAQCGIFWAHRIDCHDTQVSDHWTDRAMELFGEPEGSSLWALLSSPLLDRGVTYRDSVYQKACFRSWVFWRDSMLENVISVGVQTPMGWHGSSYKDHGFDLPYDV